MLLLNQFGKYKAHHTGKSHASLRCNMITEPKYQRSNKLIQQRSLSNLNMIYCISLSSFFPRKHRPRLRQQRFCTSTVRGINDALTGCFKVEFAMRSNQSSSGALMLIIISLKTNAKLRLEDHMFKHSSRPHEKGMKINKQKQNMKKFQL